MFSKHVRICVLIGKNINCQYFVWCGFVVVSRLYNFFFGFLLCKCTSANPIQRQNVTFDRTFHRKFGCWEPFLLHLFFIIIIFFRQHFHWRTNISRIARWCFDWIGCSKIRECYALARVCISFCFLLFVSTSKMEWVIFYIFCLYSRKRKLYHKQVSWSSFFCYMLFGSY